MNVEAWLKLISYDHMMASQQEGLTITAWEGDILTPAPLDGLFRTHLIQLLDDGEIFTLEINTEDDVYDRFLGFRSFYRASSTRALNQGVLSNCIDIINRWKTIESAQGKKSIRPMR